jgi:ketosteroid isomerase-like protein
MNYIITLFALITALQCQQNDVASQILMATATMEEAWNNDQKIKIAEAYTDDSYVISTRGIEAQGREQINAYWRDFIGKPVEWKLSNYLISEDLEKIYQDDRWKARKKHMPHWSDHNVELPEKPVYQYGQSMLVWERGSEMITSTVEFLLIWQHTPKGWKIFLDAYN